MEKKATSVCVLLGILGVAAAVLGFAAEATRVKIDEVYISTLTATCFYPSSPARALGIVAAAILVVTQVIINITTGCACCRRKAPTDMLSSNTTIQRIFATVSWIGFIAGFVLFMIGTMLNQATNDATLKGDYYWCYVVKPGVFAGASILTLVSVGAGIGYINLVFKPALTASDVEGQGAPGAIPVAQPQFGQQQQQPQYNQKQQQQFIAQPQQQFIAQPQQQFIAQPQQQMVAQPQYNQKQQQQFIAQPQQQMVAQPPMGLAQPVQYPPPNPHY